MQAASLEILEKANVPAPQARAIVQAIGIEIAGARDTLATKHDLLLLRTDLHTEIGELRSDLRAEMAGLRSNLDTRVADLRTEMHANASSNMRQTYLALLSQMAVLLGIAYFCVAHLHRYA
jgi:hypothetical protein